MEAFSQSGTMPVFLIIGAPAVGKSTTSRALAGRFPKSIHIPVDDVRSMVVSGVLHPSDIWSEALIEQLTAARESVAQMAIRYSKAGFVVVIDDFWDPNSRLTEYQALFEALEVSKVLLFPDQAAALERNSKRSVPGEIRDYIAGGIRTVYQHLSQEIPGLEREGWRVIDTTAKSVEETVAAILQMP